MSNTQRTKCVDDNFSNTTDRLVTLDGVVCEKRISRALNALKLVGGRVHCEPGCLKRLLEEESAAGAFETSARKRTNGALLLCQEKNLSSRGV